MNPKFLILTGLVLLAASCRIIPHWPNFTPVGAIALFGGAYFSSKRLAFAVPLVAMLLSDLVLSFIHGYEFFNVVRVLIYLAFASIVFLGLGLKGKIGVGRLAMSGLFAGVLFFLLSNLGVWLSGTLYPQTVTGLLLCYEAAIPFFRYTLGGNLFYIAVLFGAFELAKYRYPRLATAN